MNERSLIRCAAAALLVAGSLMAGPGPTRAAEVRPHKIYGVIRAMAPDGKSLQFQSRTSIVTVDLTEAQATGRTGAMPLDHSAVIYGRPGRNGTFHALFFSHASDNPRLWPSDD